jgi:hypothetical protein
MKISLQQILKKTEKIISSNKGTLLMEIIVSLLIFSILITAVTLMLRVSLGMTGSITLHAGDVQDVVNNVILADFDDEEQATITFSYIIPGAGERTATHKVIVNASDDGILAFYPSDEESGDEP